MRSTRSTLMTAACIWSFATVAPAADEASAPVATTPISATQVAAVNSATATVANASPKNGEQQPAVKSDSGAKALSGMSILGNQEAPKALVIVPWKSSQLGEQQGIAKQLDDGRQAVDRDVFMRELSYYEIRTGSK